MSCMSQLKTRFKCLKRPIFLPYFCVRLLQSNRQFFGSQFRIYQWMLSNNLDGCQVTIFTPKLHLRCGNLLNSKKHRFLFFFLTKSRVEESVWKTHNYTKIALNPIRVILRNFTTKLHFRCRKMLNFA